MLPVEPIAETWALLGIPKSLPFTDGLLAAAAKVHGLTLVTRNIADVAQTWLFRAQSLFSVMLVCVRMDGKGWLRSHNARAAAVGLILSLCHQPSSSP